MLATNMTSLSTKKLAIVRFMDDRVRQSYSDGEQTRHGNDANVDVDKRRKRTRKSKFFRCVQALPADLNKATILNYAFRIMKRPQLRFLNSNH